MCARVDACTNRARQRSRAPPLLCSGAREHRHIHLAAARHLRIESWNSLIKNCKCAGFPPLLKDVEVRELLNHARNLPLAKFVNLRRRSERAAHGSEQGDNRLLQSRIIICGEEEEDDGTRARDGAKWESWGFGAKSREYTMAFLVLLDLVPVSTLSKRSHATNHSQNKRSYVTSAIRKFPFLHP